MNEHELANLPRVDGFRQRGIAMTRIETFTDAAFAFSLTLLVISFDSLPQSFEAFTLALKNIPSFAGSFATLATFWYGHYVWSRRYGLDDVPTVLYSLAFVFVMLIYVYPLRMVFSGLFAWISGEWFPFIFPDFTSQDLIRIFAIYGAGFASMGGILALLYRHALKRADKLALDPLEIFTTRSGMQAWTIMASVGMASLIWALVMPPRIGTWAATLYSLLAVIMPAFGIMKRRQWQRSYTSTR